MQPVKKTTLYLSADIERRLRDAARRTRRPQAELIREALYQYLENEVPTSSWIGSIDDWDVTGENSEDWLRANWRPR